MKFNFSKKSKFRFYSTYVFSRLLIPIDVKKGRRNIAFTELIWVSSKIIRFKPFLFGKRSYYETKFGKFHIHPDLISTVAVSPSFERIEMDMLLQLIQKDLKKNKKVLFVDVGAFFGLYSIAVGNRFKKYKNLETISFEPDTYYLSDPTFNLLKKNIKQNNLQRSRLYHFGLGASNQEKNKLGIKIKKLDSVITKNQIKKFDKVYMKIDVDGYEKEVLKGSKEFIKDSKELTILIEDFVDNEIISYLEKSFDFVSKPSSYNSFWIKR